MEFKEILGIVATVIAIVAFSPYIRSIFKGNTKPHLFSWIVWAITTFIVFFAQVSGKAGAGAWPTGASAIIIIYVAFLAYRKQGDIIITKVDWVFFISALSALPFWYFTSDPLWAVAILTTVDFLGFGPTFRKAYDHPYDELLVFFALTVVRDLLAIMALENYSAITLMFPIMTGSTCIVFIAMVLVRRRPA